ncbi:MAG: biopolymer transporter ExbD [Chitinophagales bacterium]|nr:biopolymer transporter ExbD [Bacteroidota bacterium]MCB9044075.1 biopolymer transporter ExbD [Chitinophagales bacterium]
MPIKKRNQINPNFNMSSMTDIIFLLLIFFMLTSSLVTTNALNLILPSSNSTAAVPSKIVTVSVNVQKEYFVNRKKVSFDQIKPTLEKELKQQKEATIVLNAEKDVPIEEVVRIMNIANEMNIKMILATKPID